MMELETLAVVALWLVIVWLALPLLLLVIYVLVSVGAAAWVLLTKGPEGRG